MTGKEIEIIILITILIAIPRALFIFWNVGDVLRKHNHIDIVLHAECGLIIIKENIILKY